MQKAPWTQDQVDSLNGYQESGVFHPFTCGGDCDDRTLVATVDGWICRGNCGYTQDWAHEFMLNWQWKPMVDARALRAAVKSDA